MNAEQRDLVSSHGNDARTSYEAIKKRKETPLPKGQLLVLFLMQLTEGMAQTQLAPYAPFLILYFGLVILIISCYIFIPIKTSKSTLNST
jgi:hypothetical protein